MNDIILKAEDLYFSYDDENTHSLNGLSIEIRRGRKWHLWVPMAPASLRSFCAATGLTVPRRVRCL